MALPLIGSFLAQSFLPGLVGAGSALANPLVAGAIGSGLGSLLQGDSFDEAIGAGLGSFFGGKLLGTLGAAGQGQTATAANALEKGLFDTAMTPSVSPAAKGMFSTPNMVQAASPINITESAGGELFGAAKEAMKQGAATMFANPMASAGSAVGSMVGQAVMAPPPDMDEESDYQRTETIPYEQNIKRPPVGYRPGTDPEFNYGFYNPSASELQTRVLQQGGLARYAEPAMMGMSTKLSSGGLAALAEGGEVEEAPQMPNEKDVIVNAVNAVKGNMPEEQAAIVLAQFVQTYGEDALKELVEDVQKGEYDNIGGKADGMIDGGGDGMSDSVPATIDGQEDLLVSKDEYVIDAPTVAMIGNGSSDAGAKKLDNMREEVRKAATGSRIQPKKIDAEGIMGLALAS